MQRDRNETELMLRGYGLTTAELFYRLPDHRSVLNSFIWQEYDLNLHTLINELSPYWKF